MKLGVMADSHDHVPKIREAVDCFRRRQVDLVVHAGDFVAPFAVAPLAELPCRVVAVFGNNDGERVVLAEKLAAIGEVHPILAEVELGGRRIAATHYPEVAAPIAASGRFDLVIYGHTHEADLRGDGAVLLNPGETGGWLTGQATVAIVDLETMQVEMLALP